MGCSLLLKQFLLLLWKNFILQIRRPVSTVFELILPTLSVVLLVGLRLGNVLPLNDICFSTFEPHQLSFPSATNFSIYFTPDNAKTNEIVNRVVKHLGVLPDIRGFNNENDLVEELTAVVANNSISCFTPGAGVIFDQLDDRSIEYTIRLRQPSNDSWDTGSRGSTTQLGPRTSNLYLEEGFLHLENAISLSIIEFYANKSINLQVSVEQFPYPSYFQDIFFTTLASNFALLVVVAFIFSAGFFVKELVVEKESRIRETMLMMGLKQWVLWSTWYLKQFLFLMLPVIVICILLKAGRIFPRTDFILLLIFLIVFVLSIISFCFLVSVWFNSGRLALAMGFTLYYLTFVPFYLVQVLGYERLGFGGKMGMCVLSNTCASLGLEFITRLEQRLEGLQWSNAATPLTADDPFHMGWVFFWLLLEIVVYMVIAWYVNGVKPGPYGIRQPFYFPFLPSYWIGHKAKTEETVSGLSGDDVDPASHEVVTGNLKVGISIKNLTKIFGLSFFAKRSSKGDKPVKKAVDNVSLKIYKGQITALLGHNGAGKTTTMSMLTGLYSPTSGTATINGYSILTDIDKIRTSLGICPQHNILFDRLTLSEHLAFFLRLKGIFDRKRVREEVAAMVEDIQLMDKKDIQASKLSGGMKRKLSVAIALIGGSEIVILDEPTSGMDPYARRATWDLLTKHKPGRTMLLTTHHMDEADILGDRIAIMAEGKLRCSGSSLFLKSKYGVGYHLTIVKDDSCDPSQVERAVKSVVSDAEKSTDVGAELSFILPSSTTGSFPQLFEKLEAEKAALGISSFGISVTTMEEVFIKVGEGVEDERLQQAGVQSHSTAKVTDDEDITVENLESVNDTALVEVQESGSSAKKQDSHKTGPPLHYSFTPNTGLVLRFQQIWAMFVKKFYISLRAYGFLISQIIFPVFFIIFANILAISIPNDTGPEPQRALTLDNSALFVDNLTLFYAQLGNVSTNNASEPFFLSGLTSSKLGARNVYDFTEATQRIRDKVEGQNFTVNDCCSYHFQILDQYCASRSAQEIQETCRGTTNFGYDICLECLSSCYNTSTNSSMLCSNRATNNQCPTSPKLSNSSIQEMQPRGSLESDDVYITEHLLRTFSGVSGRPEFFFRSFQAGFSVNIREPPCSVCGCRTSEGISDFISNNSQCNSQNVGRAGNGECTADRQTVGAVFPDQEREIEASVWYNNQPMHMSAAALNIFHNFLLRRETRDQSLSIVINNHPLPRSESEQINDATSAGVVVAIGVIVGFFVVFAFSSMIASFVVVPVEEEEKKVKHLQFLSGIHPSSYWLASYGWDLLNTLFPIVITIIIFAAFRVDAFRSSSVLGAIFILLLLAVWAGIPISYMASFLFSNSFTASGIVNLMFIFSAILPQTIILVVQLSSDNGESTANVLHYIFLITPTYGLVSAFTDLVLNENLRATCAQFPQLTKEECLAFSPISSNFVDNPLSIERPGIGGILLFMFFEGILYFTIVLLIQNKFFIPELKVLLRKDGDKDCASSIPLLMGQDSDVQAEATRVLSGATNGDDAIIMKNLVKVYSSHLSGCKVKPAKRAVNGINLAIPSGECFGLLGVNGAGKTTTFGMLTGEFAITSGTAIIDGFDVDTNLKDVQQRIGYCPQFDALLESLTGRELLTLFARLRGVPEKQIKEVVEVEINRLDLKKHANKRCEKYSGGNKRKLCTAIALIGNPPIVLLDEPTTGLDPTTKRYLWNVLTGIIQEGRSIVLTSHSMEECEALCTRLAIMVNGSFRCLGSVQHLKNKFSSGLTLQAKVGLSPQTEDPALVRRQSSRRSIRSPTRGYSSMSEEPSEQSPSGPVETIQLGDENGSQLKSVTGPYDATALHTFIRETFPGAILLEEHQGFVSYQLPGGNLSWSSTFREIESNKERLGIVDYSVSQTTLDQVFINFAKEQKEQ